MPATQEMKVVELVSKASPVQVYRDLGKIRALKTLAVTPLVAAGVLALVFMCAWHFPDVGKDQALLEIGGFLLLSQLLAYATSPMVALYFKSQKNPKTPKKSATDQLLDYSRFLNTEAAKYDNAYVRHQECKFLWSVAQGMLLFLVVVAVGLDQFWTFMVACAATGMMLICGVLQQQVAPCEMPVSASDAERLVICMSRSPALGGVLGFLLGMTLSLAMPVVDGKLVEVDRMLQDLQVPLDTLREPAEKLHHLSTIADAVANGTLEDLPKEQKSEVFEAGAKAAVEGVAKLLGC